VPALPYTDDIRSESRVEGYLGIKRNGFGQKIRGYTLAAIGQIVPAQDWLMAEKWLANHGQPIEREEATGAQNF